MTYFLTGPQGRARRVQGRPPAMSGWFDDLMDIAAPGFSAATSATRAANAANEVIGCVNGANKDPKIKQVDDYIATIAGTWNPTGFYTPDEINGTVGVIYGYLTAGQASVMASPNPREVDDRAFAVNQSVGEIQKQIAAGQVFSTAATGAAADGTNVVNAPGFKRWVISALQALSSAMVTRSVLECSVDFIDQLMGFLSSVWGLIKDIGSLIVKAGQTVFKIPDMIGSLVTAVKWGVVIGGGAWLAFKIHEEMGRRGR